MWTPFSNRRLAPEARTTLTESVVQRSESKMRERTLGPTLSQKAERVTAI